MRKDQIRTHVNTAGRFKKAAVSIICSATMAMSLVPAVALATEAAAAPADEAVSALAAADANSTLHMWFIDGGTYASGDTFDLGIVADNYTTQGVISCGQINVSFDASKLTLNSITSTDAAGSLVERGNSIDNEAGTAVVTFYANATGKISLGTLNFTVKQGAANGKVAIGITDCVAGVSGDLADKPVAFSAEYANVAIQNGETDATAAQAFVNRLYTIVHDREPDDGGLAYWTDQVLNGMGPAAVASSFFGSQEFVSAGHSTDEAVDLVYQAVFGRPSDAEGAAYWIGQIETGYTTVEKFAAISCNSEEFKTLCQQWNLVVKTPSPVETFVNRLYEIAHGRTPDADGLEFWCSIVKAFGPGYVASSAFSSNEFIDAGYSSTEAATRVYKAIYDREPDAGGLAYYARLLENNTVTAAQLAEVFCETPEFADHCRDWGLDY